MFRPWGTVCTGPNGKVHDAGNSAVATRGLATAAITCFCWHTLITSSIMSNIQLDAQVVRVCAVRRYSNQKVEKPPIILFTKNGQRKLRCCSESNGKSSSQNNYNYIRLCTIQGRPGELGTPRRPQAQTKRLHQRQPPAPLFRASAAKMQAKVNDFLII